MEEYSEVFVGLDVAKDRHAVALAESGRTGEVRYVGEISSDSASVRRLVRKLGRPGVRLRFCYEAGPTGYGLKRDIEALGYECAVIAPSLIPRKPGDRVKTNRRDAEKLARLFRAGELTEIWTPDAAHEAIRDLIRAREAAVKDRTRKRQEIRSFLLRHGKIYPGLKAWGTRYLKWLHGLSFSYRSQQAVLQELILAESQCRERVARLEKAIEDGLLDWPLAPVVERLQALRGVQLICAATFMVEIGDVRRFANPRQLMAYLGLVPSERSTGDAVRRGGITKAGNARVRRVLAESAWTYRYPAKLGKRKYFESRHMPEVVRDIAWNAQARLTKRYRAMIARGKRSTVAVTAIARELAAFMWAIARADEQQAGT
ncbi:transposase [Mesorhizobium loti]|uniref:Transposase n=1 Tax=Rhizobium loti TaxID=381 RepID=A0A8E2W8C3_RHILI|nr:IS110 family transposase [Mesorhizobium loti]PWJ88227.1 transposase [Mesorhizobium loti]